MADPISILAIAGLVYAGRKLSKSDEKYTVEGNSIQGQEEVLPPPIDDLYSRDISINDSYLGAPSPLVEPGYSSKQEMSTFGDISPQSRSSGGEVLDMRNRMMYDGGRMNNL